jgi:hypothetical protein
MVMTLIRGFMSITEDITVILTVSACLWRTRPIATRRGAKKLSHKWAASIRHPAAPR